MKQSLFSNAGGAYSTTALPGKTRERPFVLAISGCLKLNRGKKLCYGRESNYGLQCVSV